MRKMQSREIRRERRNPITRQSARSTRSFSNSVKTYLLLQCRYFYFVRALAHNLHRDAAQLLHCILRIFGIASNSYQTRQKTLFVPAGLSFLAFAAPEILSSKS